MNGGTRQAPAARLDAAGPDPVGRTWSDLHAEVVALAAGEPVLASHLHATVIRHGSLDAALTHLLSGRLATDGVPAIALREVFAEACAGEPGLVVAFAADLRAIAERDPAAIGLANPFLNHKGFHALQSHRIAHWYWRERRLALAQFLQSRVSEIFAVDIHPAAVVGTGVFIDHGTGVVIGETAVVGDNVSILQGVTLGGTGKDCGDRHPKIGPGVLLSAGAKVLGNIRVGEGAKVGANSVVLTEVAPHTTVVGIPARVVGRPRGEQPALDMDQQFDFGSG